MRAYSIDLRQRVLAALDRGMTRQQVVITFGVSLATLKRWLILQRNAAPLLPKASPGRRRVIAVEHHVALWQQLEMHPDATLASHAEQWNATHGGSLSSRTLSRAIQRLGWTRKKRRWEPPNVMNRPELPIENE